MIIIQNTTFWCIKNGANASMPEIAKLVTRILDGGIDFRKYVETNIMMMFEGIPIAIIMDRITNCQISLFCFTNQI